MYRRKILPGVARTKARGLLDMLYTPAELAGELSLTLADVRNMLRAGLPHTSENKRRVWVNGSDVVRWAGEQAEKAKHGRRCHLADDEGFCLCCRVPVKMIAPQPVTVDGVRFIRSKCPQCGRTVNRTVFERGKHGQS